MNHPVKTAVAALLLTSTAFTSAYALDGKVYSPRVTKGEMELEYAGTRTFDGDKSKNDIQENQFSIGYGITDFWAAELYYATFERGPGQPQDYTANEFENIFQLTPTGKYWMDVGVLASYHLAAKKDAVDSIELKLLLQKDWNRFTTIANFGGEREVGNRAAAGNELSSAINTRYRWLSYFEPGIELQSDYGTWDDHASFNQKEHYIGPIAYGTILPGLKYEAGFYKGISTASASTAARAKIEYEIYF